MTLLVWFTGLLLMMVVHELGHVSMAMLVGLPLREIRFGSHRGGRQVAVIRGVPIRIAFGFSGRAMFKYDDGPRLLLRARLVLVAGVLANGLFVPLLFSSDGVAQEVGLGASLFVILNLVPYRWRDHTSDGLAIIKAPANVAAWQAGAPLRAAAAESARAVATYTPDQAGALIADVRRRAGNPDTGVAWAFVLAHVSIDAGNLRDDVELLRRHLEGPHLVSRARAHMANAIAWHLLCVDGGPNHCTDVVAQQMADFCSDLAVRLEPDCAHAHTRAEVLRRLGRFEESLPFAKQAVELAGPSLAEDERRAVVATLSAVQQRTRDTADERTVPFPAEGTGEGPYAGV